MNLIVECGEGGIKAASKMFGLICGLDGGHVHGGKDDGRRTGKALKMLADHGPPVFQGEHSERRRI